ncbi:MAG: 4a-hydroxytetrahydrobiopterin dehydratase [Gammaproteobacteria bacterium]|nr:4a-hydroxytetrahydrobiopterin dehydratase [Gammaproteobacteria bacterium]
MGSLSQAHCRAIRPDEAGLNETEISDFLNQLNSSWKLKDNARSIERTLSFNDFYETMSFVNAAAWIAHQQDHHPEIQVSYKHCLISYTTHSINGLSLNDFICAARINTITDQ